MEKLRWPEKNEDFKKSLDKYQFEEAASFLNIERGNVNFIRDIKEAFSIDKIYADDISKDLHKQAVYLLPMLFKGLVITTNFDKVLEEVYINNNNKFYAVGHPGHKEMLNLALRTKDKATLYKFHGDISEPSNAVLTKESYDENYKEDSDLFKELKKSFEHKIMLFLGYSLNKDRTMEVLKKALTPGMENYAILDCEAEKLRERSRDLGNIGIRAILYPCKKYEVVRIILERLLEMTDKIAFGRLTHFESRVINSTNKFKTDRFRYDFGKFGFFGRTKELNRLNEFCSSNSDEKLK